MSNTHRGLIHVYTGSGKGKTTAAFGLALRAAGHGWHTYVGQFMKGQDYGELRAATLLGSDDAGQPLLTIAQFGKPTFTHVTGVTAEDIRMAQEGLAQAREAMLSERYEIVVLDEINVALHFELLTVSEVLRTIDQKPDRVELVLTGQRVPDAILDRADYITVMQQDRHPYQRGILARKGIEF